MNGARFGSPMKATRVCFDRFFSPFFVPKMKVMSCVFFGTVEIS